MLDATSLPIAFEDTRLRPLSELDKEEYAHGSRDEPVRRFDHLPAPYYTPESVPRMIHDEVTPGLSSDTFTVLALADTGTDRLVGFLVLFDISSDSAEVGFWIHPDAREEGRARRGLELASRFAHSSGLRRLTARTFPEDRALQRCLTTAGFREVERRAGITPTEHSKKPIRYRRDLVSNAQWPLETERLRLRLHKAGDAEWDCRMGR